MKKTKLGISVGLLGASLYFIGLFSGYVAAVILAGYILLFEENVWLRKSAVKALAVMIMFSFWIAVANLIPNAIDLIDDIASVFEGSFCIPFASNLVSAVVTALNFIEKLLLLVLGVKALNQGTIPLPVIDGLIDKYSG